MNTTEDSKEKSKIIKDTLAPSTQSNDKDKEEGAIHHLERELQKTEKRLKDVIFLCLLTLIVFFNAVIFKEFDNWSGPICISIFELILIICTGRVYDVKEIEIMSDKILSVFNKENKPND